MPKKEVNETQFKCIKEEIKSAERYVPSEFDSDLNKKKSVSLTMHYLAKKKNLDFSEVAPFVTEQIKSDKPDGKIDAFYFNDDDENDSIYFETIQTKFCENLISPKIAGDGDLIIFDNVIKIITKTFEEEKSISLEENLKNFYSQAQTKTVYGKIVFLSNGIISEEARNKLKKYFNEKINVNEFIKNNIEIAFFDLSDFITDKRVDIIENLVLDSNRDMFSTAGNIGYSAIDGSALDSEKRVSLYIVQTSLFNLINFYQKIGNLNSLRENVRFWKGDKNKINNKILETLKKDPESFILKNNGVSIIGVNVKPETTVNNPLIKIKNPYIINGGQTTNTLFNYYNSKKEEKKIYESKNNSENSPEVLSIEKEIKEIEDKLKLAKVLIRVYSTEQEEADVNLNITYTSNSQNAITDADLKSNHKNQLHIKKEFGIKEIMLWTKEGESNEFKYNKMIHNIYLIQIYVSIYESNPGLAKSSKTKTFNQYFDTVFSRIDDERVEQLLRCFYISDKFDKIKKNMDTLENKARINIMLQGKLAYLYIISKLDPNILSCHFENIENILKKQIEYTNNIIDSIIKEERDLKGSEYTLMNIFKNSNIVKAINNKLKNISEY